MQMENLIVSMQNQCQNKVSSHCLCNLFETGKRANGSMVKESAHHIIIMTSSKGKIRLSPVFNVTWSAGIYSFKECKHQFH